MSALAQSKINQTQSSSVTTISAAARVDYILRFSKQAVMVIDDDISLCSEVGTQFLANLSDEQNAAYISVSAKLNNLQVRCRIIEQLFGNVLFDPEQSVAVSLINLVKQSNQAVTIVIDNAHYLSLQLLHELSQLAEIAKKADYQINVLMLALPEVGTTIRQHQSLFTKKLSIVSAQTGQLISHNAKIFRTQSSLFIMTPFKKWLLFMITIVSLSAALLVSLYQRDVFSFSKVLASSSIDQNMNIQSQTFATDTLLEKGLIDNTNNMAVAEDIYKALAGNNVVDKTTEILIENAQPQEIMLALQLSEYQGVKSQNIVTIDESNNVDKTLINIPSTKDTIELQKASEQATLEKQNIEEVSQHLIPERKVVNYLNQTEGYVIQISGFTQKHVLEEFIADYPRIKFHQYKRMVNNREMTILTSDYFQTRKQAELGLNDLPLSIRERSPWIKSISLINDEINQFQDSQSRVNKVTIPIS